MSDSILRILRSLGVMLLLAAPAAAAPADPEAERFFETKVRPVLVEHCYECHSARATKLKGGLALDRGAGVLKGGDSGPAVVPGDADASRIIEAIRYGNPDLEMPPDGKLPDASIADLTEWVRRGASWPAGETGEPG